MQRTPAGLPLGMPGMAEEMEGAMQQAPQPGMQLKVMAAAYAKPSGASSCFKPDSRRRYKVVKGRVAEGVGE